MGPGPHAGALRLLYQAALVGEAPATAVALPPPPRCRGRRWPSTTGASSQPALGRLRGKLAYRPLVFDLLPGSSPCSACSGWSRR
ncbi:MAG: hypothetical protein U1E38_00925 [Rhodospirillales bacterium]